MNYIYIIKTFLIINLLLVGCKHTDNTTDSLISLEKTDNVNANLLETNVKKERSTEEVPSNEDVVQNLLSKITKPNVKTNENNNEKEIEAVSRISNSGPLYCEEEIDSIIKDAKLSKGLVERKKLRFGTIIFAKNQGSNFYLFITPMGVFSEETLTMSKYGESVECFEEGEYFQILKDN